MKLESGRKYKTGSPHCFAHIIEQKGTENPLFVGEAMSPGQVWPMIWDEQGYPKMHVKDFNFQLTIPIEDMELELIYQLQTLKHNFDRHADWILRVEDSARKAGHHGYLIDRIAALETPLWKKILKVLNKLAGVCIPFWKI